MFDVGYMLRRRGRIRSFLVISVEEWMEIKWEKRENNEIKRKQTQSGFVMKFLFVIMNSSVDFG